MASRVRTAAIFIYSHIRRQSTTWSHCGWQKRKHGATLFPAGLFNYRRSENALLSECRVTNNRSHVRAATPFCLVNRIFAQPCACVVIRGDPRAADARESMHIVDFQGDIAACLTRDIKFLFYFLCVYLLVAFCSNFATTKKQWKV